MNLAYALITERMEDEQIQNFDQALYRGAVDDAWQEEGD